MIFFFHSCIVLYLTNNTKQVTSADTDTPTLEGMPHIWVWPLVGGAYKRVTTVYRRCKAVFSLKRNC
jgi:hypothetical protein